MSRSLRQTLCLLFALTLSASLFPLDDAYGRGGGRGGGGGSRASMSRGGGGASPRVNRSVSTQNRGNFNSYPSSSRSTVNRSTTSRSTSNRTTVDRSTVNRSTVDRSTAQQNRSTAQQNRSGERTDRQGERQDYRTDRQDNRQVTQGERQDYRTDRQGERQDYRTDRVDNRQDFIDDNYDNNYWRGGGWYGGGYYTPPGWGWVGLTTGLVIGAAIADPPPYYSTIYVGNDEYLYSDGVYFEPSGDEYIVVAPPTKAVVTYLPDGCTTIEQNGMVYYNCSGIYYQPVFQNGTTVYQVVQF